MSPTSTKTIKRKVKKIEFIYQEYLFKLDKLKKIQNEIIDQFVKEMSEKKIANIRKSLR